ncbi:S8 family serine peptidase [Xanthomonas sp. NCPPB 1638]|uniref:S53 family peptidase n=1 Tax=Xanthomonas TaxID=338 RepID=UPI0023687AC7|nr:S53 family peptidase [Xanthomonas cucurbitae]WDM77349.1 S53 family peptidase [Xanthomonas cucurbitae]
MMRTPLSMALLASVVTVCSTSSVCAANLDLHPLDVSSRVSSSAPMAPESRLQVTLVLKPRLDAAAQHTAIDQWLTHDSADPMLRATLDRGTQGAASDIAQIKQYFLKYGITDVQAVSDGRLLQVGSTVAALQSAFGVTLRSGSLDGRAVYFNQNPIQLPAALRDTVQGVLGLDNLSLARPPRRAVPSADAQSADAMLRTMVAAAPAAAASEVVRHSVEELNSAYGANALAPASDVVGAVIAVGNLQTTLVRLQHFQALHGLHTPVTVITVGDPAAQGYGVVNDEVEWNMDTQLLLGSAGGLKRLLIYNVPDFTFKSLVDGMTRASDDNLARVVSMSIGAAETDINEAVFQAMDASLSKAVRQGQNFLISSGDDGIYQPLSARANAPYYDSLKGRPQQRQVAFPASDPYAIAVGATELQTKVGSPGTYVAEHVWNAGVGSQISQGGASRLGAAPQWQKSMIAGQVSSGRRAVPDVSFNGAFSSSAQILSSDAQGNEAPWYVWGTSASAPTFAGYVARLLQSHPNLGFIGPQIYRYADQRSQAQRGHDVLVGTNGLYGDGYTAVSGWDFASGWGSLDIGDFDRFLAHASP